MGDERPVSRFCGWVGDVYFFVIGSIAASVHTYK